MDDSARLEAVVDALRSIASDLDELMFDELRAAAAQGHGRPAADKRVLAARRAIDKAIHVLRDVGPDESH